MTPSLKPLLSSKEMLLNCATLILVSALMISGPTFVGTYTGTATDVWKVIVYAGAAFAVVPFIIFSTVYLLLLPIVLISEISNAPFFKNDTNTTRNIVGGVP